MSNLNNAIVGTKIDPRQLGQALNALPQVVQGMMTQHNHAPHAAPPSAPTNAVSLMAEAARHVNAGAPPSHRSTPLPPAQPAPPAGPQAGIPGSDHPDLSGPESIAVRILQQIQAVERSITLLPSNVPFMDAVAQALLRSGALDHVIEKRAAALMSASPVLPIGPADSAPKLVGYKALLSLAMPDDGADMRVAWFPADHPQTPNQIQVLIYNQEHGEYDPVELLPEYMEAVRVAFSELPAISYGTYYWASLHHLWDRPPQ